MKKHLYCLGIIVSFIIPAGVSAQYSMGFYLNGSLPGNSLHSSGYNNGAGMAMEYVSPPLNKSKNFHIRIGAGFEYMSYGQSSKVKDIAINTAGNKGSVYLANDMNALYLTPKFIFNAEGKINPYFDVLGAIRGFNTWQTTTYSQPAEKQEQYSSANLFKNRMGHYGASAGLVYNISKYFALDFRVSYSQGGPVSFARLSTLQKSLESPNNITYDKKYSPTSNILTFRLGMVINLHKCEICKKYNCTGK